MYVDVQCIVHTVCTVRTYAVVHLHNILCNWLWAHTGLQDIRLFRPNNCQWLMTFSGVDCVIVNVQYALSLELLPASMCSFREASACCLGVFTHIVLLLLSALSDVGTVDFRLLLPLQKSENPNWPSKYKLYQNVIEYSKIDWSLCFFVFCNWTSNLKSTVDLCSSYLRKYFLLYQRLLYQRCRQIVCICVHLMAQILLLTPPPRQHLSSTQGEGMQTVKTSVMV